MSLSFTGLRIIRNTNIAFEQTHSVILAEQGIVHKSLLRLCFPCIYVRVSFGLSLPDNLDGREYDPRVWQHFVLEIVHEIIVTAILALPLIQVAQL